MSDYLQSLCHEPEPAAQTSTNRMQVPYNAFWHRQAWLPIKPVLFTPFTSQNVNFIT